MADDRPTTVDGFATDLLPPGTTITPQPEPTSPRIKELLSKGLTAPETLTPDEVREMTASVVYHLIQAKKTGVIGS